MPFHLRQNQGLDVLTYKEPQSDRGTENPAPVLAPSPFPLVGSGLSSTGSLEKSPSPNPAGTSSRGFHAPHKISTRPRTGTGGSSIYSEASVGSPVAAGNRRTLSDRVKSTPSSLVRQLRIYSNSISVADNGTPNDSEPSLASPRSPTPASDANSLFLLNKQVSENLPPELSPIVNLINAQRLRTYAIGRLSVPGQIDAGSKVWLEVEAKLTGTELAIWRPSDDPYAVVNDEFKPKYINLVDCDIEFFSAYKEIRFIQDFTGTSLVVRCQDSADFVHWVLAIQLSKFEHTSLNEAFTAVMLSIKGPSLSDIHILLSPKKRFPKFEWCNLRLPQISSKWLKVYVAIIPAQGKKNGRVEVYTSEKVTKKNLILYIDTASSVYNVYPEHYNMIDLNSIMKLNGEIYVNRQHEHLFVHTDPSESPKKGHSRTGSSSSLASTKTASGRHSRSASLNSSSSFFHNAPSPGVNDSPSETKKDKSRTSFFKPKNIQNFVSANYLYLMPIPHPGVTALEIMIRNFIHIIDAFRLYGRPDHLISDKTDQASMLFGLPSLPHYEYISTGEAIVIGSKNIRLAEQSLWNEFAWRSAIKAHLSSLQASESKYAGSGSILDLYRDLEVGTAEINDLETVSSPRIAMPQFPAQDASPNPQFDLDSLSDEPVTGDSVLGEPLDFSSQHFQFHQSNQRGLDPITDMPTPIDEIHPYLNLVVVDKK